MEENGEIVCLREIVVRWDNYNIDIKIYSLWREVPLKLFLP